MAGDVGPLDGVGTASYFGGPWQVLVRDSIAYVSDNGTAALRKINLNTREITTLLSDQDAIAGIALSKGGDSVFFSVKGNIIRLLRLSSNTVFTVDTVVDTPIDAMVCDKKGNLYFAGAFSQRIQRLDATGNYKTIAGKLNSEGFVNGIDTLARFNRIASMAFSQTEDTMYISDRFNSRIRRLVLSTKQVTTIPSILTLLGPRQLALNDRKDTLYIANSSGHTIFRYAIKSNTGSQWCGLAGTPGYVDSTLTFSRFNFPMGIAWSKGGILCADNTNQRIRIISPSGKVKTFAGVGLIADGNGINCRFNVPLDIVKHPRKDTLYISDQNTNALRQYNLRTGDVTTLAGNGKAGKSDGIGFAAFLDRPAGLAMSRTGDTLFFCEPYINKIRMVNTRTREVKWLAGSDTTGFKDKATGKYAWFNQPQDIARYGDSLFIADMGNHKIRIYNIKTGAVTTFAGSTSGFKDSTRLLSRFNRPITLEFVGRRLFIGEDGGLRIRVIQLDTNKVRNWVGNGAFANEDGYGAQAKFRGIRKMNYDPERKFLLVGGYLNEGYLRGVFVNQPFAGTFNLLTGFEDGFLGQAKFSGPLGSWADTVNHRIIIADAGNNRIRNIQQLGNTPPSANVDTLITVFEDSPFAPTDSFTTNMSAGNGPVDAGQSYVFDVKSNPISKLAQPCVLLPDGKIYTQPAHDSTGIVELRVKMKDSGGTPINTSDTAIYFSRLKIIPVNDPPYFRIIGNDTSASGSNRTVASWIDSSSAGPWDERYQPISYSVETNHPDWFSQAPTIVMDTLKYTSLPNTVGVVSCTIRCKDNGGTSNGGIDESLNQLFQIVLFDPLGINQLNSGDFKIWPNPASDRVNFSNLPDDVLYFTWTNALGKEVGRQSSKGIKNSIYIPDNVKGLTLLTLEGKENRTYKVMVVR